jgi:xanthine dehydrogenase accessory factor
MQDVVIAALELLKVNGQGIIGTVVVGHPQFCPTGSKFLVDVMDNQICKGIDDQLFGLLTPNFAKVTESRTSRLVTLNWREAEIKVFLDPISPQNHVVICGGGHIALPLVNIAKLLNYRVSVIDDRFSFANKQRFPLADNVICAEFGEGLRSFAFDASTYVIVVTRGHRHDRTCLEEILRGPMPGYIGMIGSRKKVLGIMQYLQELGLPDTLLSQVHAPIGLDIGAETPEEIAVSIMSELIMHRHGRNTLRNLGQGSEANSGV